MDRNRESHLSAIGQDPANLDVTSTLSGDFKSGPDKGAEQLVAG